MSRLPPCMTSVTDPLYPSDPFLEIIIILILIFATIWHLLRNFIVPNYIAIILYQLP